MFFQREGLNTGMGYPGMLGNLYPWRYLRTMPEQRSVTSEVDPALGAALDQVTSRSLSNLSYSMIL